MICACRLSTARRSARLTTRVHPSERYREHLQTKNKPVTVTTTCYRLRSFFGDVNLDVNSLSLKKCQDLYTALTNRQKADTHRNALAEAKTF